MADRRLLPVDVPGGNTLIAAVFMIQDQQSKALDLDFKMIDGFVPNANDKAQLILALRALADAVELDLEMDEGLFPRA